MRRKVGCMLLAGGAGSRMGYVNKMKMSYRDITFGEIIQHELEQLELPCFISVANYECEELPGWTVVKDIKVADEEGFIGPMGGLLSCLYAARDQGLEGLFVVSCDMPLFKNKLFSVLEDHIENKDIVIWRTRDDRFHPTCGYYSVNTIEIIEKLLEEKCYRLRRIMSETKSLILDTRDFDISDKCFTNVNDKEQYDKLIGQL